MKTLSTTTRTLSFGLAACLFLSLAACSNRSVKDKDTTPKQPEITSTKDTDTESSTQKTATDSTQAKKLDDTSIARPETFSDSILNFNLQVTSRKYATLNLDIIRASQSAEKNTPMTHQQFSLAGVLEDGYASLQNAEGTLQAELYCAEGNVDCTQYTVEVKVVNGTNDQRASLEVAQYTANQVNIQFSAEQTKKHGKVFKDFVEKYTKEAATLTSTLKVGRVLNGRSAFFQLEMNFEDESQSMIAGSLGKNQKVYLTPSMAKLAQSSTQIQMTALNVDSESLPQSFQIQFDQDQPIEILQVLLRN